MKVVVSERVSGVVNSLYIFRGTYKWRAVVSTVMNLQFP